VLVSMANLTFARKSVAYLYVTVSLLSFGANPWLLNLRIPCPWFCLLKFGDVVRNWICDC
jgi:hypothetical protein